MATEPAVTFAAALSPEPSARPSMATLSTLVKQHPKLERNPFALLFEAMSKTPPQERFARQWSKYSSPWGTVSLLAEEFVLPCPESLALVPPSLASIVIAASEDKYYSAESPDVIAQPAPQVGDQTTRTNEPQGMHPNEADSSNRDIENESTHRLDARQSDPHSPHPKVPEHVIHLVCRIGRLDYLRQVLESPRLPSVDTRTGHGQTGLWLAAFFGHTEIVAELLARKACPTVVDTQLNLTPLFCAAQNGHVRVVQLLLEFFIDSQNNNDNHQINNDQNNNNQNNNNEINNNQNNNNQNNNNNNQINNNQNNNNENNNNQINNNQNNNENNNNENIDNQVKNRIVEIVEQEQGQGISRTTPLFAAAQNGHAECVSVLLKANADPNRVRRSDGCSPLGAASAVGATQAISVLLNARASVDYRQPNGDSALWLAVNAQSADAVRLLVKARATISAGVVCEMAQRDTGILQLLLHEGKADPNARKENGINPLWSAATGGNMKSVALLLANGAELNAQSVSGAYALMGALWNGHEGVCHLLLDHRIDVSMTTKAGWDFIMIAAQLGNALLLKRALADPRARVDCTVNGRTALDLAIASGHADCVELLMARGAPAVDSQIEKLPSWLQVIAKKYGYLV